MHDTKNLIKCWDLNEGIKHTTTMTAKTSSTTTIIQRKKNKNKNHKLLLQQAMKLVIKQAIQTIGFKVFCFLFITNVQKMFYKYQYTMNHHHQIKITDTIIILIIKQL